MSAPCDGNLIGVMKTDLFPSFLLFPLDGSHRSDTVKPSKHFSKSSFGEIDNQPEKTQ
jgi:hypothetical protein